MFLLVNSVFDLMYYPLRPMFVLLRQLLVAAYINEKLLAKLTLPKSEGSHCNLHAAYIQQDPMNFIPV